MSIIEEGPERKVRMAHVGVIGSFSVNGVAELQSTLLKENVLPDFHAMYPDRFNNKTNGVTPRRFMRLANPRLSTLITATIGDGWLNDLERLRALEPHADDPSFRRAWREIKQQNKADLAAVTARTHGGRSRLRHTLRRDGQAAARVQAPVAESPAHHHYVQSDQSRSRRWTSSRARAFSAPSPPRATSPPS